VLIPVEAERNTQAFLRSVEFFRKVLPASKMDRL
jgi:hypothetical protein